MDILAHECIVLAIRQSGSEIPHFNYEVIAYNNLCVLYFILTYYSIMTYSIIIQKYLCDVFID